MLARVKPKIIGTGVCAPVLKNKEMPDFVMLIKCQPLVVSLKK